MPGRNSKRLYNKLLYIYTGIIVGVVGILVTYFIIDARNQRIEENQGYIRLLCEDAADYMNDSYDRAGYILEDLYKSVTEMDDLIYYLTHEPEEYQKNALKKYMGMDSFVYKGFNDFTVDVFAMNPDVLRITVLGYQKNDVTIFYEDDRVIHSVDKKIVNQRLEEDNLADKGEFSFRKEIRDTVTGEAVGCMILTFSAAPLEKYFRYYEKADLLVFNLAGNVIYDSQGIYDVSEIFEKTPTKKRITPYRRSETVDKYEIIVHMAEVDAEKVPLGTMLMIFAIGAATVAVGELFLYYYLKRLESRIDNILAGMDQITMGNLGVRLPVDKNGDELDIIANRFNTMCEELDTYIQKSYMAEIEQKNAELDALQSQINPHFLYNTLEVIRMKALCNGDRDVGKMLYSLAVIFRSQVKEDGVITIAQELHYCKKYLELFQFRYQNQFQSFIQCPEELYQEPVIKFVLQPVIENYFIHGMRKDDNDNFIRIRVSKEDGEISLIVEDNGEGMEDEQLNQKNRELAQNIKSDTKSIGISNVNKRIKAVYGTAYGVLLQHRKPAGLRVIIKYKPEEKE